MYRRYSPRNTFPQENSTPCPSNQQGTPLPPSPGMPKAQWEEQQQRHPGSPPHNQAAHNTPAPNRNQSHASGEKNHPPAANNAAPPKQGNPCRNYAHSTLNAGRKPGNLNFQPPHDHHHTYAPPPKKKNPLLGFLPPTIYNPDTKKILGFLDAEELLLAALILMLLENEEQDNTLLIYALLYILLGDRLDLSKFGLSFGL